jgi:hypothetical protein
LRERAGLVIADPPRDARQSAALDPDVICTAVIDDYGLDASTLMHRHDPHLARAVAAWLCRRHSEATLHELALRSGLFRASSVPNLTKRLEAHLETSPRLARELAAIMRHVKGQADTRTNRVDRQKAAERQATARTETVRRKTKNEL